MIKKITAIVHFFRIYLEDSFRYSKHSSTFARKLNNEQLCGRIAAVAHTIEKGLTLPKTRDLYGKTKIRRLLQLIEYGVGSDDLLVQHHSAVGLGVLEAYLSYHKKNNVHHSFLEETSDKISTIYTKFDKKHVCDGGVRQLNFVESVEFDHLQRSFDTLVRRRCSVRNYSSQNVSNDLIEKAVSLAARTPSVCNRQSWRVRFYKSRKAIDDILRFHQGNIGFGSSIPNLAIISADLSSFQGVKERNQPFVDGGLFAMTLILSLLANGVDSCPLNWSASKNNDNSLRKYAKIKENEVVIMLVAFGYAKQDCKYAISERKNIQFLMSYED